MIQILFVKVWVINQLIRLGYHAKYIEAVLREYEREGRGSANKNS